MMVKTCQEIPKEQVSSFNMHDSELVFDKMALTPGEVVLDFGCGAGDYAVKAATEVGADGMVYAVDKWPEVMERIKERAEEKQLKNLFPVLTDITDSPLPLKPNSIDVCFLITVLHIPWISKDYTCLLKELKRVIKTDGRIIVINCNKKPMSFGPPIHMRLSPEDTDQAMHTFGFTRKNDITDLGDNYLCEYIPA